MREQLPPTSGMWSLYKMGGFKPVISSMMGGQNAGQIAFIRHLMKEQRQTSLLHTPLKQIEFSVFDLETTGFSPQHHDEIISFGAIQVTGNQYHEDRTFYSLVNPKRDIPVEIEQLTGITNTMAEEAPELIDVLQQFFAFVESRILIAHGAGHDKPFLEAALRKTSRATLSHRLLDTMRIGKWLYPQLQDHSLDAWLEHYHIPIRGRHHSLEDAAMTARLWVKMIHELALRQVHTLGDLYTSLST